MRIGLLTTSFPRHAGDYAGSFVGDRLQRLLDEGHQVEVLAAGVAGDGPSVTVDGRLTVRRVAASPALFYGEGAPEALERGGAIWLAAARFSSALAAAARQGQGRWDAIESHWLVPSALAASAAAPNHLRRAFAHSGDVALLERIPFGRTIARRLARDGTRLRFVSADLQAGSRGSAARRRTSAASKRSTSRGRSSRRAQRRTRHFGAGSVLRRPRSWRSDGWFRSRGMRLCCTDARAPAPGPPRPEARRWSSSVRDRNGRA